MNDQTKHYLEQKASNWNEDIRLSGSIICFLGVDPQCMRWNKGNQHRVAEERKCDNRNEEMNCIM